MFIIIGLVMLIGSVTCIQFSFIPSPNITILQSAVYQCAVTGVSQSDTVAIQWQINSISSSNYGLFKSYTNIIGIEDHGIGTQNSSVIIPGNNTSLNGTIISCIATGLVKDERLYANRSSSTLYIQGKPKRVNLLCHQYECLTIQCNWSVPYTLPGVDITQYNISITTDNQLVHQTTLVNTRYIHNITNTGTINIGISVTAICEWELAGEMDRVQISFNQICDVQPLATTSTVSSSSVITSSYHSTMLPTSSVTPRSNTSSLAIGFAVSIVIIIMLIIVIILIMITYHIKNKHIKDCHSQTNTIKNTENGILENLLDRAISNEEEKENYPKAIRGMAMEIQHSPFYMNTSVSSFTVNEFDGLRISSNSRIDSSKSSSSKIHSSLPTLIIPSNEQNNKSTTNNNNNNELCLLNQDIQDKIKVLQNLPLYLCRSISTYTIGELDKYRRTMTNRTGSYTIDNQLVDDISNHTLYGNIPSDIQLSIPTLSDGNRLSCREYLKLIEKDGQSESDALASYNINDIYSVLSMDQTGSLTFIFLVKNVASVIPNQWKTFGEALNISHDELFVIQHYYGHDFHKFCRVIEEWRLSDTIPFTCEVLLAVLHSIEQDSLGRELRTKRYLINVYN